MSDPHRASVILNVFFIVCYIALVFLVSLVLSVMAKDFHQAGAIGQNSARELRVPVANLKDSPMSISAEKA
jgi:hypothetical protein